MPFLVLRARTRPKGQVICTPVLANAANLKKRRGGREKSVVVGLSWPALTQTENQVADSKDTRLRHTETPYTQTYMVDTQI